MKAYYGGQIKREYRGDLAVVVTTNSDRKGYDAFMYPTNSDEFAHLTGSRAVLHPTDRVYIGVSHQAGEALLRSTNGKKIGELDFRSIDELVVIPYFSTPQKE